MREKINLTGQKFGSLTVLRRGEKDNTGKTRWYCKCDCGKTVLVRTNGLRTGNSTSCGCKRTEGVKRSNTKHGESRDRLYKIWGNMKQRISNPNLDDFKYYGGKGIGLCEEWEEYNGFRKWALENGYSKELTIDRKDNNKGYFPDNCRWVDMKTQCNNRESNYNITFNGETKTLNEWAEYLGISRTTLSSRLHRSGWNIEKAFKKNINK